MTPVDMEFLVENGDVGDCVRASTAAILDLRRDDVPHFVRDYQGNWRNPWEDWLRDRGLIVVELDPRQRPDCLYLGCGPTQRTKEYRPAAHMVVMNWTEVAHDPHPSRAGLTTLDRVYLLVPLSPRLGLSLPREPGISPWLNVSPRSATISTSTSSMSTNSASRTSMPALCRPRCSSAWPRRSRPRAGWSSCPSPSPARVTSR